VTPATDDRQRQAAQRQATQRQARQATQRQTTQRQARQATQRRARHADHSAVFGGGPIWIRSPMYAPTMVNMMPMAAMMTYMNESIVRTGCDLMGQATVGMLTNSAATVGSANVLPGETMPTRSPPRNQTGMLTSIP